MGLFWRVFSFLLVGFYCFLAYSVDGALTKNFTFITVIHYSIKSWRTWWNQWFCKALELTFKTKSLNNFQCGSLCEQTASSKQSVVPGCRHRLQGGQKLHGYFCIDFPKFLAKGVCTLQCRPQVPQLPQPWQRKLSLMHQSLSHPGPLTAPPFLPHQLPTPYSLSPLPLV